MIQARYAAGTDIKVSGTIRFNGSVPPSFTAEASLVLPGTSTLAAGTSKVGCTVSGADVVAHFVRNMTTLIKPGVYEVAFVVIVAGEKYAVERSEIYVGPAIPA